MAIDPLTGGEELANTIAGIVGKFIPDPQAAAQASQAILTTLQASDASQNTVDAAEAANPDLFVSGWRPAVGWVCVAALVYSYLLVPIGMWAGYALGHPIPKPPVLDNNLWELMFGLLGMGGLRSWEKIKGVA